MHGSECLVTSREVLNSIGLLGSLLDLYADTATVEIPEVREVGEDPLRIIELVILLSVDRERPIDHFMLCVRVIRAADYLGADKVLREMADRLGCNVDFLANTTPVSTLRTYVCNRYRKTRRILSKCDGGLCLVCNSTLLGPFPSVTRTQKTIVSTCCQKEIHLACWRNLPTCQVCDLPLLSLPCAFCRRPIPVLQESYYGHFEVQKHNRLVLNTIYYRYFVKALFNIQYMTLAYLSYTALFFPSSSCVPLPGCPAVVRTFVFPATWKLVSRTPTVPAAQH